MSRIYIYDPRLNIQEETTVEQVMGFTGFTRKTIMFVSGHQRRLSVTGCYLSRTRLTAQQRKTLHAQEQFPGERWRPVCGYETLYEVSDHGRVRSRRQKGQELNILTPYFKTGVWSTCVKLRDATGEAHARVSKLVYEAFHGRLKNEVVVHKNKLIYENMLENLEAVPRSVVNRRAASQSNATPIYKYDPVSFEILDEYATLKEASRENYTGRRVIRETCLGQRSDAFGNHFCYMSDYERLKREQFAGVESGELQHV